MAAPAEVLFVFSAAQIHPHLSPNVHQTRYVSGFVLPPYLRTLYPFKKSAGIFTPLLNPACPAAGLPLIPSQT